MLALLAACAAPEPLPAGVVPLDPIAHLVRVSMILRGVRPTRAELLDVQQSPDQVEQYARAWVDDPRFGDTVREITDHAWRAQTELLQLPASGSLRGVPMSRLRTSLLSGPGRMAERVVLDDLPFTDIVTADWFVADAVVATAWTDVDGFDYAQPDAWQVVRWGDGRPAAGLLSDSGLWMRFRSPNSNFNRQRANATSRALLCHDFLASDVAEPDVVVDLTDIDAANAAVTSDPGCVACHQDLDGLAGFFPFEPFWSVPNMRFPYQPYGPSYERQWEDMTGRPPAYFGLGGGDLADLGRYVADDPRFAACTVRRFYGWFAQLDPDAVPGDVAAELQEVFVTSGYDAKELALAAVLHPSLARSHALADGVDVKGYLTASPRQLARMVEDLTGFRWEADIETTCCDAPAGSSAYGTVELPTDQFVGYDVVGGGFDGDAVPDPKRTPSTTGLSFQRRLAEHAAAWVAANPSPLLVVDPLDPALDERAVRLQLADLHLRILGEPVLPYDPQVDETWALWAAARGHGGVEYAWQVAVTALLRDVRATTY